MTCPTGSKNPNCVRFPTIFLTVKRLGPGQHDFVADCSVVGKSGCSISPDVREFLSRRRCHMLAVLRSRVPPPGAMQQREREREREFDDGCSNLKSDATKVAINTSEPRLGCAASVKARPDAVRLTTPTTAISLWQS